MNHPLADLKDIHIPQQVDIWPPAYGWWLLTFIVLTIVVIAIWYARRAYQHKLAKRQAVQALKAISEADPQWPQALNSVLKRVVDTYCSDLPVKAMYGQQWADFLSACLPAKQRAGFAQQMSTLQASLYQPQAADVSQFKAMQTLCINWVKHSAVTTAKHRRQLASYVAEQQQPSGLQGVSNV